jgi:diketogulonate reductase-like aldo/keto reductase
MIRWGLQQGQTMIPKSVNPVRIRQNADVFDFTLSDKQMRLLAELDEGFRFCQNPLDQP